MASPPKTRAATQQVHRLEQGRLSRAIRSNEPGIGLTQADVDLTQIPKPSDP
jgi:hypothetical protein